MRIYDPEHPETHPEWNGDTSKGSQYWYLRFYEGMSHDQAVSFIDYEEKDKSGLELAELISDEDQYSSVYHGVDNNQ